MLRWQLSLIQELSLFFTRYCDYLFHKEIYWTRMKNMGKSARVVFFLSQIRG